MDRALVLTSARQLAFEDISDRPLAPDEVRIRTLYSGVSAGTELSQYRATSPYMNRQWDADRKVFRDGEPSWSFPVRNLGYEEVGDIVETGSQVKELRVGQKLYGTWGHRTGHIMREADVGGRVLPDGAEPRIGVFSHIGAVALNGVHDAHIRIGDLVVVFGLGVPGQVVVQAAAASGATVVGVDPVPARREMAERGGAAFTLDPNAVSISDAIKDRNQGKGADVCIEVSGFLPALSEAIRTVTYAGRVVAMGFFQGEARGLFLGDEFHHNRIELISSQISGVAPEASHRWSKPRLWRTAVELQHKGVLNLLPLITDEVPFDHAPQLFERLDQGDAAILQSVLTFEGEL